MKKYNEKNNCPKCGGIARTKYSAHKDDYCTIESIQRICVRCGYVWHELPKDVKIEQDNCNEHCDNWSSGVFECSCGQKLKLESYNGRVNIMYLKYEWTTITNTR